MFKVRVVLFTNNQFFGYSVMPGRFRSLKEADAAAKEYTRSFPYSVYQIREYDEGRANIISFENETDTGAVVYETVEFLHELYLRDDICAVEWLSLVLSEKKNAMHGVVMSLSDVTLTNFLDWAGDSDWFCKGHQIYSRLEEK